MFDALKFLQENFKTPAELIALLAAHKIGPPKDNTAYKWFSRATVPSEWLPVLLFVLELENGEPVSMARYVGQTK